VTRRDENESSGFTATGTQAFVVSQYGALVVPQFPVPLARAPSDGCMQVFAAT
jgi:hypothetical protein